MDSATPPDDDAGPLVALTVERITDTVESMHAAIVAPWLRATKAVPRAKAGWSGTAAVYAAVRTVGAAAAGSAASRSPALGRLVPIGNALWGDELGRRNTASGADRANTLSVLPVQQGSGRNLKGHVVLLHGLGETEEVWSAAGIVDRLVEAGHPVVLVRYNSGCSVADSGRALADTLDNTDIGDTMTLVGFSMGGLVGRAAAHAAQEANHSWVDALDHPAIITIGAPHVGSPIEKGVEWASQALKVSAYSRPLSDFVERRSAGIQDLRHGTAEATDNPLTRDAVLADDVATIAGTMAENPDGTLGRLFGDLVVRPSSATAVDSRKQAVFGGVHHSGLLADERVQKQLLEWLAD